MKAESPHTATFPGTHFFHNSGRNLTLPKKSYISTTSNSVGAGGGQGCLGTLDGACIEALLVHCASAVEANDGTVAQQMMWVLNNAASPSGDTNQRLAYWFLRALVARASKTCPNTAFIAFKPSSSRRATTSTASAETPAMSVTELAGYVDLIPWHRFGFCATNGAILQAAQGCHTVHVLDLNTTHCMQWPTLIDELTKLRPSAPRLRVTVPRARPPVPPYVNVNIDEIGRRLRNFAESKGVEFEFCVIEDTDSRSSAGFTTDLSAGSKATYVDLTQVDLRDGEKLIVNCQNWLRYVSPVERDGFLHAILTLSPTLLTVVDEDRDLDSPSLSGRIAACFDYLWIPFDALDTFLPKDNPRRASYEANVGRKIENVVALEGAARVERPESAIHLARRLKQLGMDGVSFDGETVAEVRAVLEEHAGGWGMKREADNMLVLTWKGHNSIFATAWTPSPGIVRVGSDLE